ncbi:MAG: ATP-binding protein [Planctomycetota bacterium]
MTANLVVSHETLLLQVRSLEQELAAKNRRLERKKRLEALGRVAAGVAHEFRNPLGGIRLTVDTLLRDEPGLRAEERLHHIQKAVAHLNLIVEELLTFTRADSLKLVPIDVRELVEGAVELAFGQGNGALMEGPATTLHGDHHALSQVLVNLLTNARQALGEGEGRIGVWWGTREGSPWIEVADEGPGIPPGEEEKVFHPFHSLREGGTGLGLSIVLSRVEAHEGEVAVVSDVWGGGGDWSGARFRMVFPMSPTEEE